MSCPDGGTCHHRCTGFYCWRVAACSALSGYGETWSPRDVANAVERTVVGSASPGGLAFLHELRKRLTARPWPWGDSGARALAWAPRLTASRNEDVVARALGYEWCDAEEHWCDPEENPVRVHLDSDGEPDVGLCKACSDETERWLRDFTWEEGLVTEAQMREDQDLVDAANEAICIEGVTPVP